MCFKFHCMLFVAVVLIFLIAQSNTAKTGSVRHPTKLSTPQECLRTCKDNEPPKTCYYHFTLENYNVLGDACQLCNQSDSSNRITDTCQCVLADGVERGILTANRMIPGPGIEVCKGDKVVIDVANHMIGMETAIHWHGVYQKGYQYYDGVPRVTQCGIAESTTFRYQWGADNPGTHFWHAHSGVQETNGLYGNVIIRQSASKDPCSSLYDDDLSEHVVLISDWMHDESSQRFPGFQNHKTGQIPESVLINGRGRYQDPETGSLTDTPLPTFTIASGRRYRFRLINAFSTVCPAQISFEGHQLSLIATDGEAVVPVAVDTIISFTGERYDFVITADQPSDAYWIQLRGLGECTRDGVQTLGILRYEDGPHEPTSAAPTYDDGLQLGIVLNPLDGFCRWPREDAICINHLKSAENVDKRILQKRADIKVFLPFRFYEYPSKELFAPNTYKNYLVNDLLLLSLIDEISFEYPPSPPLSQINDIDPQLFCNGDNRPKDCGDDCRCTHTIDIPLGAIVEVVLVDEVKQPNVSHPFHLHGYSFNVIGMGSSPFENISRINLQHAIEMDNKGLLERTFDQPPGKDTIAVPYGGYVIFRFRANNPGYWFFHCHFVYHMEIGMNVIFHVGTRRDLPPIPPGFPTCGNHLPPIIPR